MAGNLKEKKKTITVDQVALPQTETFFFSRSENMKNKQNSSLLCHLSPAEDF